MKGISLQLMGIALVISAIGIYVRDGHGIMIGITVGVGLIFCLIGLFINL